MVKYFETNRADAELRVQHKECDGSCEEHSGEVVLVDNRHFGYFAYCQNAIAEDRARGCDFFIVE